MNLAQIREHVVKRTGRYDLVGVTGGSPDFTADNGIDAFINEAMRYLCDRLPDLCETRYVEGSVAVGEYEIQADYLRAAEMLRMWDADKSLVKPQMKSEAWMVDYYELVLGDSDLEQGTPTHWCEVSETPSASVSVSLTAQLGIMNFILSRMAGIEDDDAAFAYGVAGDGLAVTETGTPSMSVLVAEGIAFLDTTPLALQANYTTAAMAAPTANPRIDKVVITSASAIQVVEGTEGAVPVAPATPADSLSLATIYHRVGETHIDTADDGVNGYITDTRVWSNK